MQCKNVEEYQLMTSVQELIESLQRLVSEDPSIAEAGAYLGDPCDPCIPVCYVDISMEGDVVIVGDKPEPEPCHAPQPITPRQLIGRLAPYGPEWTVLLQVDDGPPRPCDGFGTCVAEVVTKLATLDPHTPVWIEDDDGWEGPLADQFWQSPIELRTLIFFAETVNQIDEDEDEGDRPRMRLVGGD